MAKDDIPILLNALRIPASFKCPQGTVCSGLEGLCLLLKRLAYPCRYFDLISTFGRPVPEMCIIANTVFDWVFNEHGFRLTSWNQPFLTPACLQGGSRRGKMRTGISLIVDWENGIYSLGLGFSPWEWDEQL